MNAKSVKRRVGYRREALHEDLARGAVPQGGSDRAFGVVFALLFAGLGAWLAASGRGAWPSHWRPHSGWRRGSGRAGSRP